MRFRTLLAASLLACLPALASAQPAVTDADRAAARDLYNGGTSLQQQSRYTEALDAFQRSFQVYPAPTTALHVAQCQASLNHLVEAEEDYRALSNARVPDGSPDAFYQAQEQARRELAEVEPRMPKVRVLVTPNAPGLMVTVDGVAINLALVGVLRAVNPGTHRVVASAPNFATAEDSVTVQERDMRDVKLVLQASTAPPPDGPPIAGPPPPYLPPKKEGPSTSLMLGLTVGAGVVAGSQEGGTQLTDRIASTGFTLGGDVGLRWARKGFIGLQVQGGFYGGAPASGNSATTLYFGAVLGLITNPEGVGFYGDVGAGYRWLDEKIASGGPTAPSALSYGGPEFELGLGIHIKAGPVRIIPKATIGMGGFTTKSAKLGGIDTPDSNFSNSAFHAFFLFGVNGFFDIPLGS
jgi:hypothetical protein